MGLICKSKKKAAAIFPESSAGGNIGFGKQSEISLFDGSMVNPMEEASSALDEKLLQEDLNEEEVVTWLLSSVENDEINSSPTRSSECSTTLSTNFDSSSQISDLDRTSYLVSLVNLDGEDSKWISDTESELDYFQSGFPSPSFQSCWGSEIRSSNSSAVSLGQSQYDLSSEQVPKASDWEDFNSDEPLFWPLEGKFNSVENWDCFCTSPCREIKKVGSKSSQGRNLKKACSSCTKDVTSSRSTASKIIDWKQRNKKDIVRINTKPLRLCKSTKVSMKIVPLDIMEDFAANAVVPIETLVGLSEFDGHEGVSSKFNKHDFSFVKCL